MKRSVSPTQLSPWCARLGAVLALTVTIRLCIIYTSSIASNNYNADTLSALGQQQERIYTNFPARINGHHRNARNQPEESDLDPFIEGEDGSADTPISSVDACRARVMTSLEQLEKTLGCMHCPESYRINSKLTICRKYFAEGRMKRDLYKNILGVTIRSDPYNVTYVTQMTVSRFDRLELVAKFWQGAISVAIYLERKDVWSTFLSRICGSSILNQRSNIIYSLMFTKGQFYPTNSLRNMALEATQTPYVLLIDIDLIPKPALDDELFSLLETGQVATNKTVWIVPAFETAGNVNVSSYDIPRTKAELTRLYHSGDVQMFHMNGWKLAYNWTLYDKWIKVHSPYEVEYNRDFEPYIVMKKEETPRYNERFLSRYRNKVSHLETLHYMEYRFQVLSDAYVVHLPHPDWADLVLSAKKYYNCAYQIYKDFKTEMKKKYPKQYAKFWKRYPGVWS